MTREEPESGLDENVMLCTCGYSNRFLAGKTPEPRRGGYGDGEQRGSG